jgi:hypothetical protein
VGQSRHRTSGGTAATRVSRHQICIFDTARQPISGKARPSFDPIRLGKMLFFLGFLRLTPDQLTLRLGSP